MKSDPALTKLNTLTKPLPSASNTSRPPGTSNTNAANEICKARPVATSFQSIARRLFEKQPGDADEHRQTEQAETDPSQTFDHSDPRGC